MKLSAFTIIDMVVGMTIGSIVISLGLGAYSSLSKSISSNSEINQKRNKNMEVVQVVLTDITSCERITYRNDTIILHGNMNHINYKIEDSCLLRLDNNIQDTLIKKVELNFGYFDNSDFINEILVQDQGDWSFRFRKEYHSLILAQNHGY